MIGQIFFLVGIVAFMLFLFWNERRTKKKEHERIEKEQLEKFPQLLRQFLDEPERREVYLILSKQESVAISLALESAIRCQVLHPKHQKDLISGAQKLKTELDKYDGVAETNAKNS